jgi:hypothetical protein
MFQIPATAWTLAGFALAHASWIVSEMSDDELLAPFALLESDGHRELRPFEAGTQAEAIAAGKQFVLHETTAGAWAFAREGTLRIGDQAADVVVVEFWEGGMAAPVALVQRFERFTKSGRFKIVGQPSLSIQGRSSSELRIDLLRAGIDSHPKVAALWDTWQ